MSESYVDPETGEIKVPQEPGTDVEVMPPGGTVAETPNRLAELLREMKDRVELDPEEISRQIVNRILQAATADEVLATGDVRHARDILGQGVLIHSIKLNESDYADGAGVYMIVEVSDPDFGESFVVSTGSGHCMAQLYRLSELGALPCKAKFTQATKPTKNGNFPMRLEPA